jgi:thiamine-phosphate pyrophosphorylase
MTDERQGERLWTALRRLPKGSGIVFRHYSLEPRERGKLLARVERIARRKRLVLLCAGPRPKRTHGVHGLQRGTGHIGLRSAPAHDLREIRAAERAGADLIFLSPVFRTRSHPNARTLGPARFAALACQTRLPVIALGGMNERRARTLKDAYGWAAIDAWSGAPDRARL